ncbi:hypothetical protein ABT275_27305 [Streptomyces sp. NPDC001185]|uniref:hypothetical protein n=1 Tax=Streptomyces sp. NPDC001185 TaxID=3154380 RepID=UPI0033195955
MARPHFMPGLVPDSLYGPVQKSILTHWTVAADMRWRGVVARSEKSAIICLAELHIAGIFLWSAR